MDLHDLMNVLTFLRLVISLLWLVVQAVTAISWRVIVVLTFKIVIPCMSKFVVGLELVRDSLAVFVAACFHAPAGAIKTNRHTTPKDPQNLTSTFKDNGSWDNSQSAVAGSDVYWPPNINGSREPCSDTIYATTPIAGVRPKHMCHGADPVSLGTPCAASTPVQEVQHKSMSAGASAMGNSTTYESALSRDLSSDLSQTNRQKFRPERYDGTTDWADYLKHFEMVAAWNGWSPLEKAAQLSMNLTHIAREAWTDSVTGTGTALSYEDLVKVMTQRFTPDGQQEAFKAEFRNRVKRRDETFLELGYALRRLAIRAFPKLNFEAREEVALDQFQVGLTDLDMRKHVSLAHPTSLDRAITLANEYLTVSQSLKPAVSQKPKVVASVQGNVPQEQTALFVMLQQVLTRLSQRPVQRKIDMAKIECFSCHKKGHFQRDCPGEDEPKVETATEPLN